MGEPPQAEARAPGEVTERRHSSNNAREIAALPPHDWLGMKERLLIGLLLAAVVLVYGNTLVNQFAMDDELYIMRNAQVTDPSLHRLFSPNPVSAVFRPVTFATLALNWALGGAEPLGYHLLNLFLHAGATWLLYVLLQELLGSLHLKEKLWLSSPRCCTPCIPFIPKPWPGPWGARNCWPPGFSLRDGFCTCAIVRSHRSPALRWRCCRRNQPSRFSRW